MKSIATLHFGEGMASLKKKETRISLENEEC